MNATRTHKALWTAVLSLLLLALLGAVLAGCGGESNSSSNNATQTAKSQETPSNLERYGIDIEVTNYMNAIDMGNKAYEEGKWEEAELCYRLAEKMYEYNEGINKNPSTNPTEHQYRAMDTCNNLGLALLQQNTKEKNEEAFAIFKYLVNESGSKTYKGGQYLLNLIIAANMNGVSVKGLQDSGALKTNDMYAIISRLLSYETSDGSSSGAEPAILIDGIFYNMVNADADLLKQKRPAEEYFDYGKIFRDAGLNDFQVGTGENAEAKTLLAVLDYCDSVNAKRFKEAEDPDIKALREYIEALERVA